jgi:hypothetical protein
MRLNGGIGRRTGLKILYRESGVRVRSPLQPIVIPNNVTSYDSGHESPKASLDVASW